MIQGSSSPYRVVVPMTFANAAELFAVGKNLITTGEEQVFDLTAVPTADSSALAVLLGWQRAAGERRLRLVSPPESIYSLATLYGVSELLGLAPLPSPPLQPEPR